MAAQIQFDQLDKDQIKSVNPQTFVILNLLFQNSQKFQDFLLSYNKLSETCFTDCVFDFTTRDVKDKEDKCSLNCMEKFLKMNQRISQRFQEFQMIANENMLAANAKLQGK
jgi:mitochondrial import inner membrane translocase subunit TIM9